MPTKTDSYGTTIGSSYANQVGLIVRTIKEAVITDDLDERRESAQNVKPLGGIHPLFITGSYPSEDKIPKIPHPISVFGIRGKNFICSDLRPVLSKNVGGVFTERIRNHQDYDFIVTRQKLTMFWAGGRSAEFRTSLRFGAYAFASWLADAIKHLKSLDEYQRMVTLITCLCYYADLTQNEEDFENHLYRSSQVPWVDAIINFPTTENVVLSVGKKPMRCLADLVERLKVVLNSPKMTNFDEGALIAAVRSHWFGHGIDAQMVVGVALEDPPTWCTLVNAALSYSGYKNSMIAQVATRLGKKGEQQSFQDAINDTVNTTLRLEGESLEDIINQAPPEDDSALSNEDLVFRAESTPDLTYLELKKE